MMELIQTAHQNGLKKVILKKNGITLIMALKKNLLQSTAMKKKIMTRHQISSQHLLKTLQKIFQNLKIKI